MAFYRTVTQESMLIELDVLDICTNIRGILGSKILSSVAHTDVQSKQVRGEEKITSQAQLS